eukprot:augustus_masked-scaffold_1-processed-gene-30.1-mRNA-1 protein AED:1.00 eAED:1.00 QI:0/-1/0/0/-1/1/1/0/268
MPKRAFTADPATMSRLKTASSESSESINFPTDQRSRFLSVVETSKPKKKTTGPVHNAKYKAKLCKNWVNKGVCPYYEKCQFAHGEHEVQKWAMRRKKLDSFNSAASSVSAVSNGQNWIPNLSGQNFGSQSWKTDKLSMNGYSGSTSALDVFQRQNELVNALAENQRRIDSLQLSRDNDIFRAAKTSEWNILANESEQDMSLTGGEFGFSWNGLDIPRTRLVEDDFVLNRGSPVYSSSDESSRSQAQRFEVSDLDVQSGFEQAFGSLRL